MSYDVSCGVIVCANACYIARVNVVYCVLDGVRYYAITCGIGIVMNDVLGCVMHCVFLDE